MFNAGCRRLGKLDPSVELEGKVSRLELTVRQAVLLSYYG